MSFEAVNKITGEYLLSPNITRRGIKRLLRISNLTSIQFGEPVTDINIWENIESILLTKIPQLKIWIYTNYDESWDLNFLKSLPSVVHFGANGYMNFENIENIALLKNLESLSIGLYNLTSFDFLTNLTSNLKELRIGETKSKKPDISFISKFQNLEHLSVAGHHKGIDAISKLKKLKSLSLHFISTENLFFLKNLENLCSVEISFGGIKDLNILSELPNIKHIELFQIRLLSNIEFISRMSNLQYLILGNMRNIKEIPSLKYNRNLRRIVFENLKGLRNLKSLEKVENLVEFKFINCSNLLPEDLIPIFKNKRIKGVIAGFGSDKANNKFEQLKIQHGIKNHDWKEFEYN